MHRKVIAPWARAFGGALIFALPMLMTMEMWQIGFYIEPLRLALLLTVSVPLLIGVSRVSGFEPTSSLGDDVIDAFLSLFIAASMAAIVLFLFGIVTPDMSTRELVGIIVLQTFAGSVGALLARSQLYDKAVSVPKKTRSYAASLFLMAVGAIFLGLNVAPTEEMVLLSYIMSPSRELALALLSIVLMHGFIYVARFRGRPESIAGGGFWFTFLRYTITGYAIVLVISLYLLWTFGRTDGTGLEELVSACVVLGFPCAIGAAASRLIL